MRQTYEVLKNIVDVLHRGGKTVPFFFVVIEQRII